MDRRVTRSLRLWLLATFLLALLSFLCAVQLSSKLVGYMLRHRAERPYTCASPASKQNVLEEGSDNSGRGAIDDWVVRINNNRPRESVFHYRDLNGNGAIDEVTLYIGHTGQTGQNACYQLLDSDGDKVSDVVQLSLGNFKNDLECYMYCDYDLDGRFDSIFRFVDHEVVEAKLRVGELLVLAKYDEQIERFVGKDETGASVSFVFTHGQWRPE